MRVSRRAVRCCPSRCAARPDVLYSDSDDRVLGLMYVSGVLLPVCGELRLERGVLACLRDDLLYRGVEPVCHARE